MTMKSNHSRYVLQWALAGADVLQLLTIPEVLKALHAGEFKPNCGLIIVNFLIRHGVVTAENEPNLVEIATRCNRRLGLAVAK
jgi:hypothetical protein